MQQDSAAYTSLRKALGILIAFTPRNTELGTTEIAEKLGLNKSTSSRLLSVLRELRFVQRNPDNRKFSLGPASAALGAAIENSLDHRLVDAAKPIADALRDELGESVVFSLVGRIGVVQAYIAEGLGHLVLKGFVGAIHGYHCTAGGKVFLAYGDPGMLEKMLARGLKKRTQNTITNPHELKEELEKIRRQGFAFDRQENYLGIQAFALPVREPGGRAVSALVVPGSAQVVRMDRKGEILPAMREAARKIEAKITNF